MDVFAITAIAAGWALSSYPLRGYWALNILLGIVLGFIMMEVAFRRGARQKPAERTELDLVSRRGLSLCFAVLGAMLLYPVWLILRDTAFRTTHPALASQALCLLGIGICVLARIGLFYHSKGRAGR